MPLLNKVFGKKSSSEPLIKIGSQYGGGIVFYVDHTGQHGLIAAKSDMEGSSPGIAAMKGLSEGLFNWPDAIAACRKSETGGFRDWILPDKEQLNHLLCINGRSAVLCMIQPTTGAPRSALTEEAG